MPTPFSHPLIRIALQSITPAGGTIADWMADYCRNPSQALPQALTTANQQTWQTIELALAGDMLTGKLKQSLASGKYQAALTPLQQYLDTQSSDYRKNCLAEFAAARNANLLEPKFDQSLLDQATTWQQCNTDLIEQAHQTIAITAQELQTDYPHLAQLLSQQDAGSSLLVTLFGYFLNQAISDDEDLRDELNFKYLRQLWKGHKTEFAALQQILVDLGADLAAAFTALATHLDTRFDNLDTGIATLYAEIQEQFARLHQPGPVTPSLTQIIHDPQERQLVRQLLQRFRALPASKQIELPELLNQLGKLQVATGELQEAKQLFEEANDAEGHYNSYRVALEEQNLDTALAALLQAAKADPQHFAPFPLHKYTPERILGAGGFGVAFLCQHNYLHQHKVVVKSLHPESLARAVTNIFSEASTLKHLKHPGIIQVEDTDYVDASRHQQPYLVIEYFAGSQSLSSYLATHGNLSAADVLIIAKLMAQALAAAHQANILHRDIKPDNILVKRDNSGNWQLKLIDFGLAAPHQLVKQSILLASSKRKTLLGVSLGGTYNYAAPEQLGMRSEEIGFYSDIYGFGKTLCFALFRMTAPTLAEWQQLGFEHPLTTLLNSCLHENPAKRPQTFTAILQTLSLNAPTTASPIQTSVAVKSPKPSQENPATVIFTTIEDPTLIADIKAAEQASYLNKEGTWISKQDPTKIKTWRNAADQGHAGAQFLMGLYFHFSSTDQDYEQAVTWYRKAAEQGNASAQNNLGYMYEYGKGVEKDYQQAVTWYRKAAEQGNASAQYNLGDMYRNGYGVEKDYQQAVTWYRKAAEQGNASAQYNLGYMYRNGYGVEKDYQQAVTWYRKAAEQGNASAQYNLGDMYEMVKA